MNYEINFLILQSQTEQLDKIREAVKKSLEEKGAKVTDELFYKKRKLAYKIKHEQYGFFNVLRFNLEEKENILPIKSALNILPEVARYIIVKADELPLLSKEIYPEKEVKEKEEAKKKSEKIIKQEDVEKILAEKKDKQEKATPKKAEEKIEKKEEKRDDSSDSSLEELDKKLEEILNI